MCFAAVLQHDMQTALMAGSMFTPLAFTSAMVLITGHQSKVGEVGYREGSASPAPLACVEYECFNRCSADNWLVAAQE